MKRVIIDARGTPEASKLGLIVAREETLAPEQEAAWEITRLKGKAEADAQMAAAEAKALEDKRLRKAVQKLLEKGILVPSDLEDKEPTR